MSSLLRNIAAAVLFALSAISCDKPGAGAPAPQPSSPGAASQPAPASAPAPEKSAKASPFPWRAHPALRGRFQPENPDDLQVFIHDGGPRVSEVTPELAWVQVTAQGEGDTFKGNVISKPLHLKKVKQGDAITFMMKRGWKQPVQIRDEYLKERGDWTISRCEKCGFDELFDPPSELLKVAGAPENAPSVEISMNCPMCGGKQAIQRKSAK